MDHPQPLELVCDVHGWEANVSAVDALARLTLEARRCGIDLRLSGLSIPLRELIARCGLAEVLRD